VRGSGRRLLAAAVAIVALVLLSTAFAPRSYADFRNDTCPDDGNVTAYDVPGKCVPGSRIIRMFWHGGQARTFVIGTDNNVWNIVSYSLLPGDHSGWQNLGIDGAMEDLSVFYDHGWYDLKIKAFHVAKGSAFGWYCNTLRTSGWSGWQYCG
jgi:hypothetical protein